jgi:hypothetical protein
MNKASFPQRLFLIPLLGLSLLASSLPAEEIAQWSPAEGTSSGAAILVPDSVGGANLQGTAENGATLEQSAEIPGGGAIVFSGDQRNALRSIPGVSLTVGTGCSLQVDFLPEATEKEMTVLSLPAVELRYLGQQQKLDIIVFYDVPQQTGNYAYVRLDAKPGDWNSVKVTLAEGELVGEVNGAVERKPLINPLKAVPSVLQLGAKADGRPFKGKLGKLSISQD